MQQQLIIFIIAEHVLVSIFLFVYFRRRIGYWKGMKRFLFRLHADPVYETIKAPGHILDTRTFIETPEVGVYQKRLFFTKRHRHTEISSLLYILGGKADVEIGTRRFTAKPGDFVFVPANVDHIWTVRKPHRYIEYLEFATPSFAQTYAKDTVWSANP
jgi:mannose-6-phosphate isomerase-like protein (cupin superfamily)